MAQLISPGVQVSIINQPSTPAVAAGTVPTVFLATQSNKLLSDGITTAPGTLPSNAGKVYTITSQRELLQTFGNPFFNIVDGTVQQADEVNEYGLHAAWSYLGLANSINVVRADLDMSQLMETENEPTSPPANGTYWFDFAGTSFGAFRANGNPIAGLAWNRIAVSTPTINEVGVAPNYVPLSTFGAAGDVAVSVFSADNAMYEKVGTTWLKIGSSQWKAARPTVLTGTASLPSATHTGTLVVGDSLTNVFSVAITVSDTLSQIVTHINTTMTTNLVPIVASISSPNLLTLTNTNGQSIVIGTGSTAQILTDLGLSAATTPGYNLVYATNNSVPTGTHAGDIWIKTTNPNFGANYVVKQYNSSLGQFQTIAAPMFADDIKAEIGGGVSIGRLYVQYNAEGTTAAPIADGVIKRLLTLAPVSETSTAFVSPAINSVLSIRTRGSAGSLSSTEVTINVGPFAGTETASQVATLINMAVATNGSIPHIVASAASSQLTISSSNGTAFDLEDVTGTPLETMTMPVGIISNWVALTYTASVNAPTSVAAEGTLWFNPELNVDFMVNDGNQWKGYRNMYPATDPDGVQVTSAQPTTQSNGNPLVDNDLWIDSSDVVNYPKIYRYMQGAWTLVDNTDHVTPLGVVFGDLRMDSGPSGSWLETRTSPLTGTAEPNSTLTIDMLHSDFCEPVDDQILNPQTFPAGILLFNTRYSTDNVKIRHNSFFAGVTTYEVGIFLDPNAPIYVGNQSLYDSDLASADAYFAANPGRWVTFSGNDLNGVALMGTFAQRACVVTAMASQIVGNEAVRDESLYFNLLAAPGYVELFSDLVELNVDRQETAFIITDVPATLTPDSTSLQAWATDANDVAADGRLGRVTAYDYAAMYYPWGLGTNVDGNQVAIPSSTIALRTFGYNDRVAYPWFPPAGTRRGIVSNASSVGYIDIATHEYKPYNVNKGQRDTLYTNNINPILFRPGQGLLVRGDKTLSANSTGLLTRINVARTVVYLRWILPQLLESFLFELNTPITQASAKDLVDKFLTQLVGQQALTDFATVCDSSNNPPDVVAANELYIDVAVVPTFAIDFIYIPVALAVSLNQ